MSWKLSLAEIQIGAQPVKRAMAKTPTDFDLLMAGSLLRDALSDLATDNENRGQNRGADVNWAAIYQARAALTIWDRTVKPIDGQRG